MKRWWDQFNISKLKKLKRLLLSNNLLLFLSIKKLEIKFRFFAFAFCD